MRRDFELVVEGGKRELVKEALEERLSELKDVFPRVILNVLEAVQKELSELE